MRDFLFRLLVAAVMTLIVFALASPGRAQQSDADPTPVTPRQQQTTPQSPARRNAQTPGQTQPPSEEQTQDALAFTGRVVKEKGVLVLNDPVTKVSYRLDDESKAKKYLGKQVKIIGKLEMKSNTIQIETIEPLL